MELQPVAVWPDIRCTVHLTSVWLARSPFKWEEHWCPCHSIPWRLKIMWVNVCKCMLDVWEVFNKCQCNLYVHHFTPQTKGSGEKSGILMVTELQVICEPKCMLNVGEVFKVSVHSFTPQREGSGGKSGSLMDIELLSGVSRIPSRGRQIPVSSDNRNYHQMTSLKDFK